MIMIGRLLSCVLLCVGVLAASPPARADDADLQAAHKLAEMTGMLAMFTSTPR